MSATITYIKNEPFNKEILIEGVTIKEVTDCVNDFNVASLSADAKKRKAQKGLTEFGSYKHIITSGTEVITYRLVILNWQPKPIVFKDLTDEHMVGLLVDIRAVNVGVPLGKYQLYRVVGSTELLTSAEVDKYYGDFQTQVIRKQNVYSLSREKAVVEVKKERATQTKRSDIRLFFHAPNSEKTLVITSFNFNDYAIRIILL